RDEITLAQRKGCFHPPVRGAGLAAKRRRRRKEQGRRLHFALLVLFRGDRFVTALRWFTRDRSAPSLPGENGRSRTGFRRSRKEPARLETVRSRSPEF